MNELDKYSKIKETKFSNSNWKRVLKFIVDYAPNGYGRGKVGYTAEHPLAKRAKVSGYELTLIMSFLEDQQLIQYDQVDFNWINVTPKGFDVQIQNENQRFNARANFVMMALTGVLAMAAIWDIVNSSVAIYYRGVFSVVVTLFLFYATALLKRIW
jgi:hypothetical protein